MTTLSTILALLPKLAPAVAALPEFKRLFDQLVATFDSEADQAELRAAYELAIDDAEDAHGKLAAIVARHR